MKVTLRNRGTGHFLTESGTWVASGLQAHDFRSAEAARAVAAGFNAREIYVYYVYDNPSLNFWGAEECGGS